MTFSKLPYQIIKLSMLLVLLLQVMLPCLAETPSRDLDNKDALTRTFVNPISSATNINSRAQIHALVTSPEFQAHLHNIANALPQSLVDEQHTFSRVALLSIRAKTKPDHIQLVEWLRQGSHEPNYYHYSLYSQIMAMMEANSLANESMSFEQTLHQDLAQRLAAMPDESLIKTSTALGWSAPRAADYLINLYAQYQSLEELTTKQAINLVTNTHLYTVLYNVMPTAIAALEKENNKRYEIQPDVLIKTRLGVEHSLTIVRKKGDVKQRPTALQFTIYADEQNHIKTAIHAAAHGYIGIVANSRGKRSSSNDIVPWEHEGKDATAVIEWISTQPWSDGRVAMYGGSYNGFTQWAATKYMHPALKTIVPYVAASPITGLPVVNNIVITANYEWAFHVTNNKTMDYSVYDNWQQSDNRNRTLFESGRSISEIDKIDGKPNPWFQKWLQHPSYDEFYQNMLPHQQEYADINIPVLSITGYFDGGQISAIDFMKRHYRYNQNADHTLLIGPYNHTTAQGIPNAYHSNYKLDPVALEKDTEEIVFAWFDHVLHGKPKPSLLQNKVNYQLMGSNTWQHADSLEALNSQSQRFYLHTQKNEKGQYLLGQSSEIQSKSLTQVVDMTDRTTEHNTNHWTVIEDKLNEPNGLIFTTEPFAEDQQFAGNITGYFSLAINKKDVDIGYNLYEITADGKVIHLSRYLSRASHAHSMNERKLLTPNQKTAVPITNSYMTAKVLNKGSRLALVLNVNKNVDAQVNLGSGKNVNIETIADAGVPLEITWFNDSYISIPVAPYKGSNIKVAINQ